MKRRLQIFGARLDIYNQNVAALNDLQIGLETDEGTLREMNRRMLSAVEAAYGPDSSEYEQAGGTRQSERKKPTAKAAGGTPTPTIVSQYHLLSPLPFGTGTGRGRKA